MSEQKQGKNSPGRPPRLIKPIPDTFENVIKALVQPVGKVDTPAPADRN